LVAWFFVCFYNDKLQAVAQFLGIGSEIPSTHPSSFVIVSTSWLQTEQEFQHYTRSILCVEDGRYFTLSESFAYRTYYCPEKKHTAKNLVLLE